MFTALTFLAAATASPAMIKPQVSPFPRFTKADCANEQTRDAKMAQLDKLADLDIKAWDNYFDARLTKLGMSSDEKEDFLDEAKDSDEYVKLQDQLDDVVSSIEDEVADLDDIDDEKAECLAVVKLLPRMKPMRKISLKMLDVIDRRINAEAKRRGIKLD